MKLGLEAVRYVGITTIALKEANFHVRKRVDVVLVIREERRKRRQAVGGAEDSVL